MTALFSLILLFAPPDPKAVPKAPPAIPPAIAKIAAEAEAARQANNLDEALALYRKAVGIAPQWAEGWWAIGTIHYDKDRYPLCRDAFRRFVALDSKNAPGQALLGLCEFQTRELPQSYAHLEKAYELGLPNGAQLTKVALYHLALLQAKAGMFERTIALCRTLVRDDPDSQRIFAVAGVAALRKPVFPQELPEGDRELAMMLGKAVASPDLRLEGGWRKDFEDVIAAYPDAPHVHYWFATVLLANDPDKGIEALKRELEISPDHVPALVQLTFEYLRRSEPENAKPYAERAVKAAPDDFTTHASLGRVLVLTEEAPRGIQELEKAVKMAPDSPQAHLWLGQAYSKVGRQQDALRERAEFARLKKAAEAAATPDIKR